MTIHQRVSWCSTKFSLVIPGQLLGQVWPCFTYLSFSLRMFSSYPYQTHKRTNTWLLLSPSFRTGTLSLMPFLFIYFFWPKKNTRPGPKSRGDIHSWWKELHGQKAKGGSEDGGWWGLHSNVKVLVTPLSCILKQVKVSDFVLCPLHDTQKNHQQQDSSTFATI